MGDWNQPQLATGYVLFLSFLKDRDIDAITLCKNDPSNIPTNAIKLDRINNKFQEYIAGAWTDLLISISGGGTGANTAAGARTNLGLGSMSVQDNNNVAITGGFINGAALSASDLLSGTVNTARLGGGATGTGQNFLADDNSWKVSVPIGSGAIWFTNVAPTGWLICDGSAISRFGFLNLFGVIGTTYGAGDGVTTFNLPDFRQRFPLGKSAAGTGNALGNTGGTVDHSHNVPATTIINGLPIVANSLALNNVGGKLGFYDGVNLFTPVGAFGVDTIGVQAYGFGITSTDTKNPPYVTVNYIIKYA